MSVLKRVSKAGKTSYLIRIQTGMDGRKKLYHTETFHGTKKDAQAREADIKKEMSGGSWRKPTKTTLAEFFAEWCDKAATLKLKGQTLELYRRVFRIYLADSLGKLPLVAVGAQAIQEHYLRLARPPHNLGARSIKNVHTCLRSCLKQAVRWRHLPFNPANDVDLPRHQAEKKIRSMEPDQAQAFLEAVRSDPAGAVLAFALLVGARPAEYLALLWPDLDWKAGTIRIERALIRPEGGGWHFDTTKTKGSRRTVTLPPELLALLREHRTRQLEQRLALGPAWKGTEDFIFTNTEGGPMDQKKLGGQRAFKRLLKAAKLPGDFRLYDLRHTCATLLLVGGVPAKVVADRLGHASVTITLDTYSHVLPSLEKQASRSLQALLYPVAGAGS